MEVTYKIKETESIEVNVEELAQAVIEEYGEIAGGVLQNAGVLDLEYIVDDMIFIFLENANAYLMERGLPEDIDLEDVDLEDLENELEKIFTKHVEKAFSRKRTIKINRI